MIFDEHSAIGADAIRASTLKAIRTGLIGTIIPSLADGDATTVGHLIVRLIDHLLITPPDAAANPAHAAATEAEIAQLAVQPGPAAQAALRDFVAAEMARLVRNDPEAAGGVVQMYRGGRTSRAEDHEAAADAPPLLTAESLTRYLRARFPDRGDRIVRRLHLLPGGMSKQTIKVITEENGNTELLVLRKDFPIAATSLSVLDEFAMLQAMWHAGGLPMAEPLWHEPNPLVFGTPVMAVSHVQGSTDYSAALHDPAAARVFAEALAGAMARLHAMPLQQTTAGPLVARGGRAHVAAEIERWHAMLERSKIGPDPVLEAAFAWLHANIPDLRAPPAIVHGDIGFHNMLMQEGRLTALLDWEFTHIGDPAEDVVYARFFVEQVIDWATFLDFYEAHGGTRPSPAQETFYAVWQSARNAAGCSGAERAFLTRPGADLKLGVSGMTFKPRFALDALQRIATAP